MAYTTTAATKGGRDGRAILDNGGLALAMALPKELGGTGEGHNPEQLFALGYSSCFGQAILAMSKKHGIDGGAAKVSAAVTLDKDETSFVLAVELKVSIPGVDRAKAEAVVHDAHQICPYSKATRGNINVTLTVV
jgi:osmotically inducible protein OsmC